jgi:hypothetical protein
MDGKNFSYLWCGILAIVALLVVANVNFGFKENMLKEELIEHTAFKISSENISICNSCGKKGFAYCSNCGRPMKWDKFAKRFMCSSCKLSGNPVCSKCKTRMVGEEYTLRNNMDFGTGQPIPVF